MKVSGIIRTIPKMPKAIKKFKTLKDLYHNLYNSFETVKDLYDSSFFYLNEWCYENDYDYNKVVNECFYGDIWKNFPKCKKSKKGSK